MIRTTAFILVTTAVVSVSGLLGAGGTTRADGPAAQIVAEVHRHLPGPPHCC